MQNFVQAELEVGRGRKIFCDGEKPSEKSTPISTTSNFGAIWGALVLRVARVFRCGSSALLEDAAISMAGGSPFAADVARRRLLDAMFAKFRLDEGESGFDIDDPIPRGDPYYDTPNAGYAEIFPIEEGGLNDATG